MYVFQSMVIFANSPIILLNTMVMVKMGPLWMTLRHFDFWFLFGMTLLYPVSFAYSCSTAVQACKYPIGTIATSYSILVCNVLFMMTDARALGLKKFVTISLVALAMLTLAMQLVLSTIGMGAWSGPSVAEQTSEDAIWAVWSPRATYVSAVMNALLFYLRVGVSLAFHRTSTTTVLESTFLRVEI
jgi:hypothetical protein